jgi:transcriptional antiterminator RfaH
MPISLRWYCAQLQRHHEADAFRHLHWAGIEAFIPLTPVERTHARKRRIVMAPLLPGYGFVRFDIDRSGWQKVWRTQFVKAIIGASGDKPTPVADGIIQALKGLKPGSDPRPLLIPEGATVAFNDGPWSDHRGICIMSDDKRALIAVELFGRITKLETDPQNLRVIRLEGKSDAAQA